MSSPVRDYAQLHFIVLIWGFTAILGLLISIPSVEMVFYRTLLSAIFLFVLLYYRKVGLRLRLQDSLKFYGTGLLIAMHWILFFASARVSNASVCLAGMATCSLWTALLEPLMYRRQIKIFEVILGALAIAGLYVIFRFEFNHALGLSMALLSAALAAVFSVLNSKFTKKHDPYLITFYEMVGACVGTALFFPLYTWYFEPGGLQMQLQSMDWLYLLILSLICTVYAYSVSVELMKRLSAFVVNLTVNLEPVYGIILAVLVFGDKEKMNPGFYLGTSIILLSVLLYPVFNRLHRGKALGIDNLR